MLVCVDPTVYESCRSTRTSARTCVRTSRIRTERNRLELEAQFLSHRKLDSKFFVKSVNVDEVEYHFVSLLALYALSWSI